MDGMEAARSAFDVLETAKVEAGVNRPPPGSEVGMPMCEFVAVDYHYPAPDTDQAVLVLDAVNLCLETGEHLAIVGPSGAGKSTLIDLMLGFDPPTRGRISIEGVPLAEVDLAAWRSRIGWVQQDPFLIAGTVLDNVRLGSVGADRSTVVSTLELVGAGELVERLDTVVGERGAGLSHGERRMISLARAIVRDPDLLLLDEPTAGVDTETQVRIAAAFPQIAAGRTVVTVAHQRILVDLADRVVRIDRGRIVAPTPGDPR
jgi:ATP-binding cassette subfamily C protein CydCD